MTGAIIGLSASAPVAIPLALVSHYALDALPHHNDEKISQRKFAVILFGDIALCFILALIIFIIRPMDWWLAIVCAFIATSPDFMWLRPYIDQRRGRASRPTSERHAVVRLHEKIQWFQKPIGIVIEIVWGIITIVCLYFLLRR